MSAPRSERELVEKLVLFQRAYSQSVLQIGLHGNIYRTDPWEEVFRFADRGVAARALAQAGYEHTCSEDEYSTGWYPRARLRRQELDRMRDGIIDAVEHLTKIIPQVPADQHNLLLAAQDNLKNAATQVAIIQESFR